MANHRIGKGDGNQLFVPLAGRDPNQVLVIELRYTLTSSPRLFEVPSFPEAPAVQKTFLSLSLPSETVLLGSTGPWTEEFHWANSQSFKREPVSRQTDDQLVQMG